MTAAKDFDNLQNAYLRFAKLQIGEIRSAVDCMQAEVVQPLVTTGLAPKGFINSYALNMYHDGSEGIQSHYDDADRFSRPIYSLRLFSDARLSFGTQLYGYTNGAFCIDMPR